MGRKTKSKSAPRKKQECQKQECVDLRLEYDDVMDQNALLLDEVAKLRNMEMPDELDDKVLYFDFQQINSYTDSVRPQVEAYSMEEGTDKKVSKSSHLFTTVIPRMVRRVMEENFSPSYRARHRLGPGQGHRGDVNKTTPMPPIQRNAVVGFLEKVFSEIPGPKAEVLTAVGDAVESNMAYYFNTGRAKIAIVPLAPVPLTEEEEAPQNCRVRSKKTNKPVTKTNSTRCRSRVAQKKKPGNEKLSPASPKRARVSVRLSSKS